MDNANVIKRSLLAPHICNVEGKVCCIRRCYAQEKQSRNFRTHFWPSNGGVFQLDEGLLIVMKRQTIINIQNKTHWSV
jgi:hypothetical protein